MMKTLEKRMAAREGFTLVELIVVIAILAILAAVAYPVYTGYISRAHDASALEQLGSIATAAQGAAAGKGKIVSKIEVSATKATGAVTGIKVYEKGSSGSDTEITGLDLASLLGVSDVTNITLDKDSSYAGGATWKPASGGEAAAWTPAPAPAPAPGE